MFVALLLDTPPWMVGEHKRCLHQSLNFLLLKQTFEAELPLLNIFCYTLSSKLFLHYVKYQQHLGLFIIEGTEVYRVNHAHQKQLENMPPNESLAFGLS